MVLSCLPQPGAGLTVRRRIVTLLDDVQAALEDLYGGDQHDEASALVDKLEDHGLTVTRLPVRDSGDERLPWEQVGQ